MPSSQRWLAIETGFPRYSLALISSTAGQHPVVAARHLSRESDRPSTFLHDDIAALLKEADWTLQNLTGLCVSTGPGSFTGMRVGIAAAQGLARALGIPAYPGDALGALARMASPESAEVLAVVDVRKSQVTAQLFRRTGKPGRVIEALSDEITDTPEMLVASLPLLRTVQPTLIGDGAIRYRAEFRGLLGDRLAIQQDPAIPHAAEMGLNAIEEFRLGKLTSLPIEALLPRYARGAETEFGHQAPKGATSS